MTTIYKVHNIDFSGAWKRGELFFTHQELSISKYQDGKWVRNFGVNTNTPFVVVDMYYSKTYKNSLIIEIFINGLIAQITKPRSTSI